MKKIEITCRVKDFRTLEIGLLRLGEVKVFDLMQIQLKKIKSWKALGYITYRYITIPEVIKASKPLQIVSPPAFIPLPQEDISLAHEIRALREDLKKVKSEAELKDKKAEGVISELKAQLREKPKPKNKGKASTKKKD